MLHPVSQMSWYSLLSPGTSRATERGTGRVTGTGRAQAAANRAVVRATRHTFRRQVTRPVMHVAFLHTAARGDAVRRVAPVRNVAFITTFGSERLPASGSG